MLSLINLELALNNFKEVEDLFSKALSSASTLMAAADVNIWSASPLPAQLTIQRPTSTTSGGRTQPTVPTPRRRARL
jgi:hypothetical protein